MLKVGLGSSVEERKKCTLWIEVKQCVVLRIRSDGVYILCDASFVMRMMKLWTKSFGVIVDLW